MEGDTKGLWWLSESDSEETAQCPSTPSSSRMASRSPPGWLLGECLSSSSSLSEKGSHCSQPEPRKVINLLPWKLVPLDLERNPKRPRRLSESDTEESAQCPPTRQARTEVNLRTWRLVPLELEQSRLTRPPVACLSKWDYRVRRPLSPRYKITGEDKETQRPLCSPLVSSTKRSGGSSRTLKGKHPKRR